MKLLCFWKVSIDQYSTCRRQEGHATHNTQHAGYPHNAIHIHTNEGHTYVHAQRSFALRLHAPNGTVIRSTQAAKSSDRLVNRQEDLVSSSGLTAHSSPANVEGRVDGSRSGSLTARDIAVTVAVRGGSSVCIVAADGMVTEGGCAGDTAVLTRTAGMRRCLCLSASSTLHQMMQQPRKRRAGKPTKKDTAIVSSVFYGLPFGLLSASLPAEPLLSLRRRVLLPPPIIMRAAERNRSATVPDVLDAPPEKRLPPDAPFKLRGGASASTRGVISGNRSTQVRSGEIRRWNRAETRIPF